MSKIEKQYTEVDDIIVDKKLLEALADGHNDHDTRIDALTLAHTGRLINVETRTKGP